MPFGVCLPGGRVVETGRPGLHSFPSTVNPVAGGTPLVASSPTGWDSAPDESGTAGRGPSTGCRIGEPSGSLSTYRILLPGPGPSRAEAGGMQQLELFLRARHGVAGYGTLTANRFSRTEIERATGAGSIRRIARGTFAVPDADPELATAARNGASLTCVSAARLLGWWVLVPGTCAHIRRNSSKEIPGTRLHRGQRSPHRPVARPEQIVHDAFLPRLEALVLAESAVIRDAVGLHRLRQEFTGQRDWPIRLLLDSIRRTTASPLEVCARFHLLAAGIGFEEEVVVPGVGRVDFLMDGWLIVEIDGYAFHSGRVEFRKDRQRWNGSSSGGWVTLRMTAEMILHQPDEFIRLVMQTRDRWAGAAPPPRGAPVRHEEGNWETVARVSP